MKEFYKKILQSKDEYWVVARETSYSEYCQMKRGDDDIIFIAIPSHIRRGLKYEEITLKDMEDLERANIEMNIFLSGTCPPFQFGITFYNIYDGFPLEGERREFIKKAWGINSNSLYDYKKLDTRSEKESNNEPK